MVTFMNRVRELLFEPFAGAKTTEYGEVETYGGGVFAVPIATARAIECELERFPFPEWIVFRTVCGARHRLAAAQIVRVSESSAESRAAMRAFNRALKEEFEREQK